MKNMLSINLFYKIFVCTVCPGHFLHQNIYDSLIYFCGIVYVFNISKRSLTIAYYKQYIFNMVIFNVINIYFCFLQDWILWPRIHALNPHISGHYYSRKIRDQSPVTVKVPLCVNSSSPPTRVSYFSPFSPPAQQDRP